MKRMVPLVTVIWMLLVGCSFWWNYSEASKNRNEIAFQTARSFFNQIVITRRWNARHGGVYVPVTETTRPNPYLEVPLRDIYVNEALMLTMINPAFMTRQISEIAADQKGVQFHITSLNPIRALNRPTPAEAEALKSFQADAREVGYFLDDRAKGTFFYMAPLYTEQSCLKCHERQGYKVGEVRGGISVTIPFTARIPLMTLAVGHLGIGLAGIIFILVFGNKLTTYYALLRKQSIIDALTGIPNRRSFSDTLLKEFSRANREKLSLSVIMCDIDNFKKYNDRYGHDAGDDCLVKVAQTIESSLKRPGDFCARYGGEEFVIILPGTTLTGAEHIAEEVRSRVESLKITHEASTPYQRVTISLGVAAVDADTGISDEELIRCADQALYQAKRQGRNRVIVFSEDPACN